MTHAALNDSNLAIPLEITTLRLHLMVAMAAADDQLHPDEIQTLDEFINQAKLNDLERTFLNNQLTSLLAEPPNLEDLLRRLVYELANSPLAQRLVDDLITVAKSDGSVDPREEGMLRLVCGALEIEPNSLYEESDRAAHDASAKDLAQLVRGLLNLQALA